MIVHDGEHFILEASMHASMHSIAEWPGLTVGGPSLVCSVAR